MPLFTPRCYFAADAARAIDYAIDCFLYFHALRAAIIIDVCHDAAMPYFAATAITERYYCHAIITFFRHCLRRQRAHYIRD